MLVRTLQSGKYILLFYFGNNHMSLFPRLCRDKPLFTETLDAIKFICKDIWAACWEKQVDNLRTNHRVSIGFDIICIAV
jgi:Transport protein particle (TRAPP) component